MAGTQRKVIRLYFEGDSRLRRGFGAFFRKSFEVRGNAKFDLIATGGTPLEDYHDGINGNPEAVNLLLLDAEELPKRREQAARFDSSRVFWMKELMEAWFLADRRALIEYCWPDKCATSLPLDVVAQSSALTPRL